MPNLYAHWESIAIQRINQTLTELGTSGVTLGIVRAAVDQVWISLKIPDAEIDTARRAWEAQREKIIRERFARLVRADKPEAESEPGGLFG